MGAQEQKWGVQLGGYRPDFNRMTRACTRLDEVEMVRGNQTSCSLKKS